MDAILIYIQAGCRAEPDPQACGAFAVEFRDVIQRRETFKLAAATCNEAIYQCFLRAAGYLTDLLSRSPEAGKYRAAILTASELLVAQLGEGCIRNGDHLTPLERQAIQALDQLQQGYPSFELIQVHPSLIDGVLEN